MNPRTRRLRKLRKRARVREQHEAFLRWLDQHAVELAQRERALLELGTGGGTAHRIEGVWFVPNPARY